MSVQLIKYREYSGPQDIESSLCPLVFIVRGDNAYKDLCKTVLENNLLLSNISDTELFIKKTDLDVYSCAKALLASSTNKNITFLALDKDLGSSLEKKEPAHGEKARAFMILSPEKAPNQQKAENLTRIAKMVEIYFTSTDTSQSTVDEIYCHPVQSINFHLVRKICDAVKNDEFLKVQNGQLITIYKPLPKQVASDSAKKAPENKRTSLTSKPSTTTYEKNPFTSENSFKSTHDPNLFLDSTLNQEDETPFFTKEEDDPTTATGTKSKRSSSTWDRFKNVFRRSSRADSQDNLTEYRERGISVGDKKKKSSTPDTTE
jgi:hypothetical protein